MGAPVAQLVRAPGRRTGDLWFKSQLGNNFSLNSYQKYYGENNLLIVKSIIKIITHVLKFLQKFFEYFTSKSNAHGTFCNSHIKINLNINISEANGSIELKFCMTSIYKI